VDEIGYGGKVAALLDGQRQVNQRHFSFKTADTVDTRLCLKDLQVLERGKMPPYYDMSPITVAAKFSH
jgi:hypothetical protein